MTSALHASVMYDFRCLVLSLSHLITLTKSQGSNYRFPVKHPINGACLAAVLTHSHASPSTFSKPITILFGSVGASTGWQASMTEAGMQQAGMTEAGMQQACMAEAEMLRTGRKDLLSKLRTSEIPTMGKEGNR